MTRAKRAGSVVQVLGCLPAKHKALRQKKKKNAWKGDISEEERRKSRFLF
jgi:hypothetical protein